MRGKPESGASQGSDKDVPNVPMDSQHKPQSEDARSEAATGVVGAVLSQLRRQSAAHGEELLPLKGAHRALGSEATKAMEVAREASQRTQLASETAGRSAATAKGANTRTTALHHDISHINKRLDEHEAATRADKEALRGRIQALEEANAAGGSHSLPSDDATEVWAAKVMIEATKRDVAAMLADVKAGVPLQSYSGAPKPFWRGSRSRCAPHAAGAPNTPRTSSRTRRPSGTSTRRPTSPCKGPKRQQRPSTRCRGTPPPHGKPPSSTASPSTPQGGTSRPRGATSPVSATTSRRSRQPRRSATKPSSGCGGTRTPTSRPPTATRRPQANGQPQPKAPPTRPRQTQLPEAGSDSRGHFLGHLGCVSMCRQAAIG